MPHGIIQRWEGRDGRQRIPELNAVVAIFGHWTLIRRRHATEDRYDAEGLYDLRASCTYLGPLINDPDYPDRKTTVTLKNVVKGKVTWERTFRVVQQPGYEQRVEGHTLVMEGVKLEDG